jgi:hypothetical protein
MKMKQAKTTRIIVLTSLLLVLILTFLYIKKQGSRIITRTEIISISNNSPKLGDRVEVKYMVFSGDADNFTVIVLPDTQHYSEAHPEIFIHQTQWIVENIRNLNIIFVTHLGDLVQNNDHVEKEWQVADKAMDLLNDVVPYSVLPGNHDMQPGGQAIFYNKYFPASRFEHQMWWGGSYNDNKNNYQFFSSGGDKYIIFHLQYCPPKEVINWADEILSSYSDRKVIISTHSFLGNESLRVSHCKNTSDGNITGVGLWNQLVKNHPNIFLVLSGHIPGWSRRTDNLNGHIVHQLLSDYQDMENGGNGYLRIMTFQPNRDIILVKTYSPTLDKYLTDPDNQFDLPFNMTSGKIPTGSVKVSYGTDVCVGTIELGGCILTLTTNSIDEIIATYSGDSNFKGSVTITYPSTISK